ncbi:dienelactone hydrolase family protein [Microbacterium sp. BK668]|uniref:dienelactone hydrolase family protein n=1 Tax=Microbacterium sp. BK668 TaxID=2512118 RepID=UPI0010D48E03|nr:dienelactone hydrolase family protein [Microbacterium sp. BK668]TDN88665.1 carboxymethylenebutenolidase [Microbacterium sp. BK668]
MAETIQLTAPDATGFDVYVARPAGRPVGGLVVIHEIWGLVDHIRDVADRFADEGWLVAAPDILSRAGVEPQLGEELFGLLNSPDEEVRTAAQPRLRDALSEMRAPGYAEWAVPALRSVVDWLEDQPDVGGRVAVTGFCFGGTYAFALAASDARLRAVVPFYGTAPSAERIAQIQAPVLALYGEQDQALVDALPGVRQAMADAGVEFEAVVYPGAQHAFFNDTGSRYSAAHAMEAWARVLAFLDEKVVGE